MEIEVKAGVPVNQRRIILVTPSAPGSKGDEGMVRGALELFKTDIVVILNPSPTSLWFDALRLSPATHARVSEASGPIPDFARRLQPKDVLFFLGADIIDGSCGIEPSLERLDLMDNARSHGLAVYVCCSFRSDVSPAILERLCFMQGVEFLVRDDLSLANFRRQTGLNCRYFPDLSFFCSSQGVDAAVESIAAIAAARDGYGPVIGLNFSEHSFRSFFDVHTKKNRILFVRTVLRQLCAAHPNAFFVLFSNDRRRWRNHPSDDYYQELAFGLVVSTLGRDRVFNVNPGLDYAANIAILESVDFLITGRMHLLLAAFRMNKVALVMMGQGKGYTSIEKMRGPSEKYLGTPDGVIFDMNQLSLVSARFLANKSILKARLFESNVELQASIAGNGANLLMGVDPALLCFE